MKIKAIYENNVLKPLGNLDLPNKALVSICLLYTSDAADDLLCVDLGGRRIIKKKKKNHTVQH